MMTASRKINKPAYTWTAEALAMLRARYPSERTDVLAAALGVSVNQVWRKASKLGLKKSDAFNASADTGRIQPGEKRGTHTQFKRGHVPVTAGTKGISGQHPNCRATQFKPGHKTSDAMPLGTVVMKRNGYMMRKVAMTGYSGTDWKLEHRLLWIEANGPIPRGMCLTFVDGNRRNLDLANLQLTTRKALALRNGINNLPPELQQVLHLRSALTKKLKHYDREQSNPTQHAR